MTLLTAAGTPDRAAVMARARSRHPRRSGRSRQQWSATLAQVYREAAAERAQRPALRHPGDGRPLNFGEGEMS